MNKTTRFISNVLFDKEINLDFFLLKKNDQKFWDKFVKIGSSHYVIPALYFKMKERNFLKLLPHELVSYLEEIYNQNLNRNTELVNEVNEISRLLKVNNINHVFLKGAALISSLYRETVGIRMVGDIDILISEDQILKAKSILESSGYKRNKTPFEPFLSAEKHLERMNNDKKVFAVELHFSITSKRNIYNQKFLHNKKIINENFIPNNKSLLFHSIINFQLNDYGSLRAAFHFRTLFDVFNLSLTEPDLIEKISNSSHVRKIKVVMKNLNIMKFNAPLKLFLFEFRFRLINSIYLFYLFNKILIDIFMIMSLSPIIRIKQIIALLYKRDYRMYALKKIRIIK